MLTDEGLEAMRQAWPTYARGIEEYVTRHITDDEARLLTDIFGRIRDAAGKD